MWNSVVGVLLLGVNVHAFVVGVEVHGCGAET